MQEIIAYLVLYVWSGLLANLSVTVASKPTLSSDGSHG
jgi:hypothetical protein